MLKLSMLSDICTRIEGELITGNPEPDTQFMDTG